MLGTYQSSGYLPVPRTFSSTSSRWTLEPTFQSFSLGSGMTPSRFSFAASFTAAMIFT